MLPFDTRRAAQLRHTDIITHTHTHTLRSAWSCWYASLQIAFVRQKNWINSYTAQGRGKKLPTVVSHFRVNTVLFSYHASAINDSVSVTWENGYLALCSQPPVTTTFLAPAIKLMPHCCFQIGGEHMAGSLFANMGEESVTPVTIQIANLQYCIFEQQSKHEMEQNKLLGWILTSYFIWFEEDNARWFTFLLHSCYAPVNSHKLIFSCDLQHDV